jgi:tRNA pseudouridine38-40 synthase
MQVRLMVGLLKSVGTGNLTTVDGLVLHSFGISHALWHISSELKWEYSSGAVERILNAKAVTAAPAMAPACGLYLANVKYDLSVWKEKIFWRISVDVTQVLFDVGYQRYV